MVLPCGDLADHRVPVRDPAVEALEGQHVYLKFRHVQPASVLRRVVDLEAVGEARRLRRLERVVERGKLVGVQIVKITGTFPLDGLWEPDRYGNPGSQVPVLTRLFR